MARVAVLRPHLKTTLLMRAAGAVGNPIRTAERWLARDRHGGLAAAVALSTPMTGAT